VGYEAQCCRLAPVVGMALVAGGACYGSVEYCMYEYSNESIS